MKVIVYIALPLLLAMSIISWALLRPTPSNIENFSVPDLIMWLVWGLFNAIICIVMAVII